MDLVTLLSRDEGKTLETSLTGTFPFVVRKDLHLRWPRGETAAHYIAMGMHEDLREAAKLAVKQIW